MIAALALAAAVAVTGAPSHGHEHHEHRSYAASTHVVHRDAPLRTWIHDAHEIMKDKGIPGGFHDIKRNVMRESAGDPNAVNDWDTNAIEGHPSKGLMQTIPSTFHAYHVEGTSKNIYDPVANIAAATNYAAARYGSIHNVHSAY